MMDKRTDDIEYSRGNEQMETAIMHLAKALCLFYDELIKNGMRAEHAIELVRDYYANVSRQKK